MATIAKRPILAEVQLHGVNPATVTYLEGLNQTFVKGELVEWTAGYLTEISSDTPGTILGVAAGSAHNVAAGAGQVPVELALPQQLFSANVVGAALADHVLVQSDCGCDMAIIRDTANSMVYLNAAVIGGANIRVRTHKQARGTLIGDTNGRVLFTFKPNWVQFLGTS